MKNIRTRFAPSPTGSLHLGGVRTALYNYLFAKQNDGVFVLRIEDTDKMREVPGSVDYIRESLEWLGIRPDEGPGYGGGYGPYVQSERTHLYGPFVDRLLASGHAYLAFDLPEELDAARAADVRFSYGQRTRMRMRNQLSLPKEEVDRLLSEGSPFVVRALIGPQDDCQFDDLVRGRVCWSSDDLDDKVLVKADGTPTYHMANVVDDHLMCITHVIRGEEWLPSAPLHMLLYRWLGLEPPAFAHLSLIMGPNGKLSKRDGDKYGFPVYPLAVGQTAGYRELGFQPDALLNVVALLGWSHPDGTEIMDLAEMCRAFDLRHVGLSGAKFDFKRAQWISSEHIKRTPGRELAELLADELGIQTPINDYSARVCELVRDRSATIADVSVGYKSIDQRPNPSLYAELTDDLTTFFVIQLRGMLSELANVDAVSAKLLFDRAVQSSGCSPRRAGIVLRAALCGNRVGPSLFDIMQLLGPYECAIRLSIA